MVSGRSTGNGKMATQPCPCGFYGDPTHECTCSSSAVVRYQQRISGPLLDRIDIYTEVPRVDYDKLSGTTLGETSASVRARVQGARARQLQRYKGSSLYCNADMGPAEVRQFCELDQAGRGLIKAAMRQLGLSARAYHRVLKLARTVADLAGSQVIEAPHLAEALQYRPRQRE
jgi:magnesium chelatase family protein